MVAAMARRADASLLQRTCESFPSEIASSTIWTEGYPFQGCSPLIDIKATTIGIGDYRLSYVCARACFGARHPRLAIETRCRWFQFGPDRAAEQQGSRRSPRVARLARPRCGLAADLALALRQIDSRSACARNGQSICQRAAKEFSFRLNNRSDDWKRGGTQIFSHDQLHTRSCFSCDSDPD